MGCARCRTAVVAIGARGEVSSMVEDNHNGRRE